MVYSLLCSLSSFAESAGAGIDGSKLQDMDEKGWLKRLSTVEIGREIYVKCLGKDEPSEEYPQGAWRFKVGVSGSGEVPTPKGLRQ